MGQDDSCPICGKHFVDCGHLPKEHLQSRNDSLTYCGRPNKSVCVLEMDIFLEGSVYEESICQVCFKCAEKDGFKFGVLKPSKYTEVRSE